MGASDRTAVVLIHGWNPGGLPNKFTDGDWPQLVSSLQTRLTGAGWKLLLYHWEEDASTGPSIDLQPNATGFSNARMAANNAFYNGAHLASELNNDAPQLRKVVFVAHSAGSWAAYRAADHLLQYNPYVVVNVVLLDPFIPGVDPSVISPLNTSTMGLLATHPSAERIYRLENYFAVDTLTDFDFDLGNGGGSRATSQTFAWRGRDINQRVDYLTTLPFGTPHTYYDGHGGPLLFYGDSAVASDGPPIPDGQAFAPWDFTSIGFYRGLVNEGFLLPSINAHPQSQTVNSGTSVNLNVTAVSSQTLSYQWFKNGQPISGASGQGYSFTASSGTVGDYVVRVSNVNGLVFSEKASVGLNVVSTPTVTSVTPRTLNGLPLPQTQLITLIGTGFTGSSRLTLNDGVNPPYTDKVPTFISATELRFNIAVGPNPATWTVKVVNGAVESLPYSFYVVSGTAQLTSLGVSGPASIAENGSGQFTATAYFSDGSQQSVTSSASWTENSSATTISSSGLLSVGSVNNNSTVTVSASYTMGGVTKSASADVIIANSGSCGSQNSDLIVNGGVESGSTGWTLSGAIVSNNGGFDRSGAYFIWFGGAVSFSDTGYQTITIPANATSATLSFYYNINSQEGNSAAFDTFSATVRSTGGALLATVANLSNIQQSSPGSCCYTLVTYNLLPYAGQSIRIHFASSNDATLVTNFRVDDVAVNITIPNPVLPVLFGVGGPTNVAEGSTAQYNAIVVNCDGSIQSVTPTWSENSSATSISSSGLLTVGSVSSDTPVTITATYSGFSPLNYPITVANSGVTFSYLAISGPSSIDENSTGQFTASAIFSDGSSQSVSPSWSEDSTATTISSGGLLTTGEVNDDTIVTVSSTHTIGGVTRTAEQEVLLNNSLPPTLTSLTINGPGSVIEYGVASFTATAGFSDGTANFINGPTWAENNSATSISIFGLLSAGGVTNDTLVTVSFSYTLGAVTLNASKNILVLDGGAPPEMPFEAKAYASVSTSAPSVVAAAQNGGLVLFGNFTGTITVGGQQFTANGAASDFYALKLDSSNQVVWVRQFGGANEEVLNGAAPHPSGGWVVSGSFRSAGLIGGVTLNAAGNRDGFVARLDESGNVLWANRCGGTGVDNGREAAADSLGNCFLLGEFRGTASFGNGAVSFTAPGALSDVFIAKYDAAGNFLWARALSGPQADTVRCAVADSAGNIFVGGAFEQQITVGAQTLTVQGNQLANDGFLAKYAANGDFAWVKQLGEPSGGSSSEFLFFVTVSSNGACFFGGSYDGPMTVDGHSLPLQTATTAFAGKVDNAGTTEWLQALPAEGTFRSDRLLVGSLLADESMIVGGLFYGTLPVGLTTLTNASVIPNENLFWAKLNPAGTPQWGISAAGDHSGDIYLIAPISDALIRSVLRFDVSGYFPGLGVLSPGNYFVVDFGSQAMPAPKLFLSQQANQLILSWPTNAVGYQLESTSTLLPNSWTTDPATPINIGSNYMVTNALSTPSKFFRLKK